MLGLGLIAWWIGVISAESAVRGSVSVWIVCARRGRRIERRAARRSPGNAGKRQRREGQTDDVDEYRRRAVGAGEIAFQRPHIEGDIVALGFRRGQYNDDILYGRSILAQHRDGGVRWILGEAVATLGPFLEQMGGERVASRADRTVCEDDGVRSDPRSVSVIPFKVAPRALSTISDGTVSVRPASGTPICFSGFCAGLLWAPADSGTAIKASKATQIPIMVFAIIALFPVFRPVRYNVLAMC